MRDRRWSRSVLPAPRHGGSRPPAGPARRWLPRHGIRVAAVLPALVAVAAGCGAGSASGSGAGATAALSCPETVMATLASVMRRVYSQGIQSERTASAEAMIERSKALRAAVEAGDAKAARAAAKALIATGHMTNLIVTTTSGRSLVKLGGPALTPLRGTIRGAARTADRDLHHERVGRQRHDRRGQRHHRGARRAACGRAQPRRLGRAAARRAGRPWHTRLARRQLPVRLAARPDLPRGEPDQDLPPEDGRGGRERCAARATRAPRSRARADRQPDLRRRARTSHAAPDPARAAQPAAAEGGRGARPVRRQEGLRSAAPPPSRAAARERGRPAALRPRRPVRARARVTPTCACTARRSAASCSRSRTTRATCG